MGQLTLEWACNRIVPDELVGISHLTLKNKELEHFSPVVRNASIRRTSTDSRQGSDEGKDLAAKVSQREAPRKRVVDENGRLDHHQEVTDRQINDENVGRRS